MIGINLNNTEILKK